MKRCFDQRACDGNRRAERSLARDVRVKDVGLFEGVNVRTIRAQCHQLPPFASAATG